MSILDNPSFYVSIFSSVCFVASEILPFLPIAPNGIVHAIFVCLGSFNNNGNKEPFISPSKNDDGNNQEILEKLDTITVDIKQILQNKTTI